MNDYRKKDMRRIGGNELKMDGWINKSEWTTETADG